MTATVPEPAVSPDEEGLSCAHCGSPQVRRSAPKGLLEYLVRSVSPVHFYRCRACGRRGSHWGRIPRAASGGAGGRPVESRDMRLRRKRRVRLVVSAAFAIGLGAASGLYLHSCQESAEAARANPPSSP
jgi:hypothetical protein